MDGIKYLAIIIVTGLFIFLFSRKPDEKTNFIQNDNYSERLRMQKEEEAIANAIPRKGEVFNPPRSTVYPSNTDIASQYSNPYLSFRDKHPVLAYQYAHDKGINPANIGDPIRVHNIGGGASGLYGTSHTPDFVDSLLFSRGSIPVHEGIPKGRDEDERAGPGNRNEDGYANSRTGDGYARRREAYSEMEGPYPGKPLNMPVPANSLKFSNEQYNPDMFRFSNLAQGTIGTAVNGVPLPGVGAWGAGRLGGPNYNRTVGTSSLAGGMPEYVTSPGADLPPQTRPLHSGDYFRPYGPNVPVSNVPFIGNVNSYAPFPEVNNPWEKSGILTSMGDKKQILNLYRRPIAPLQDLWEYQVQDKNGFVIKLPEKYLENGDIIPRVTGHDDGPWKVHDYVQNKYIWV